MSRWHPFNDEPRAAVAARLVVLGGQMALDRRGGRPVPIQPVLIDDIRRAFSGDGILCEDGVVAGPAPDPAYWWVLGPVDDTGVPDSMLPGFAVSVGVLCEGKPLAGAVYDPLTDSLFTAATGRGAWLNGRGLRVSSPPLSSDTCFSIRTPYDGDVPPFVVRWLRRYRVRHFGSTALQVCHVAAGGLRFVYDQAASLTELAGAAGVLLEAGGVITGVDGAGLFPLDPGDPGGQFTAFVAGDPLAHLESLGDILALTGQPLGR